MYHAPMVFHDSSRIPTLAEPMLSALLQSTGTQRLANALWLEWPETRQATLAITWFLTDRIVHPSGYSLLSLCLIKAFRRHQERLHQLGDPRDLRVCAAYFAGLLEALPALVEVRVRAGSHEWDVLHGPPLGDWLLVHPNATFELVAPEGEAADRSPAALRLHWLGQLLPATTLAGLSGHLPTITGS